jgi:pimeloyl-ACP methyl ester carboxylesterase
MTGKRVMEMLVAKYTDGCFGQVHYYRSIAVGKAPVIFINPRTRSCFQLIPHLAADRPAFFIDVPGYGNSIPPTRSTSMAEIASCVVSVMDAENIAEAFLCGFHTGGKIAAATAALIPDRISGVSICGKSHSIIPDHQRRNEAMTTQIAARKPDYILIMMETFTADDHAGQTGRQLVYEANFAYDLAQAVGELPCNAQVVEFTSDDEDKAHGRQAQALADLAPRGFAVTLPQIEPLGTELYAGTENIAKVLGAFIGDR